MSRRTAFPTVQQFQFPDDAVNFLGQTTVLALLPFPGHARVNVPRVFQVALSL